MGARVAIAGASGYAGGELLRLVAGHPDLEVAAITADSNAGRLVSEVHPNLSCAPELSALRFAASTAAELADCDLVFLTLPAGQSAAAAARLPDSVKIVDLGPDFRLADAAAWSRHYPGEHAGHWTCGLPELPGARAQIAAAGRVAVPGCYATASILALAPLLAAGLVSADDIVIVAASGTSGAGRAARLELLGSEVMGSVAAYQAGGAHRHTPEIEQALTLQARAAQTLAGHAPAGQAGSTASVSFTPVLAPMPRGILATCTARLLPGEPGPAQGSPAQGHPARAGGQPASGQSASAQAVSSPAGPVLSSPILAGTGEVRDALARAYAGEPFVTVLPDGRYPATGAVAGSSAVHLQAVADPRTGRATVLAAIDNLGKGAAGQAIQVANLMLGLPETAGLTAAGIAP